MHLSWHSEGVNDWGMAMCSKAFICDQDEIKMYTKKVAKK